MSSSSTSSSWTEYRRPPDPFTSSPPRTAAAEPHQSSWSAIVTKSNVSPGVDDDDDNDDDRKNNDNNMKSMAIPPFPLYAHTSTTATAMSTTMNRRHPQIASQQLFKRSASLSIDNHNRSNITKHALTPNRTFQRCDSCAPLSSSTATTTTTSELDSIVHTIHQHYKLDCPSNNHIVYSCVNGCTPLGMEYISDPIIVNLDYYLTTTTIATTRTLLVENVAVIISKLNQTSLGYNNQTNSITVFGGVAGDDCDDGLRDILDILEMAAKYCHRGMEVITNYSNSNNNNSNGDFTGGRRGRGGRYSDEKGRLCVIVNFIRLLEVMVHSNIGTVNFRLNKVRESLISYETAMAILDRYSDDKECYNCKDEFYHNNNDNRTLSRDYLLLVLRLNLSRVLLRLKRTDDATKYCDMICVHDNDRHQQHRKTKLSHQSRLSCTTTAALLAHEHDMDRRINWLHLVAEHYITGLIHENRGETSDDYKLAYQHYNQLLLIARAKLDHRHPYICTILERRGAVLFEQRKLQCSMLSYLACLKIIEYQQSVNSVYFTVANLSRILYAVARVLHDKEEYHDALHIYQRALKFQRSLASISERPTTLDVITTLCNISRVHHLSGEIDAALSANKEVLELTFTLVGGRVDHPFLIHRLKFEGNILVEAGRLEEAMSTFVNAARQCGDDGRDRMMTEMMGGHNTTTSVVSSQEDADAGDSSVLSIRSAAALAQMTFFHPAAASA